MGAKQQLVALLMAIASADCSLSSASAFERLEKALFKDCRALRICDTTTCARAQPAIDRPQRNYGAEKDRTLGSDNVILAGMF